MNLLDHFILQHVQVSLLKGELLQVRSGKGKHEAKVELNLTPRLINGEQSDALPVYQVTAKLSCKGGIEESKEPAFRAQVRFEAIYQQVDGAAVDLADFTANHPSLTRQLYPLLQQELRTVLLRMGLEQVHLPFDIPARVDSAESQTVQVSGSLH